MKLLFAYLVLTLSIITAHANSSDVVFSNITSKDGLSQNDVNCILQDSFGFMWFGTYDGVCRYDGYDFAYYRLAPNEPNSLNSNLIHTIAEDQYHNIWVGTDDRGLSVIRHSDQKVFPIVIPQDDANLLEREVICAINFFDDIAVITAKEAVYFLQIEANSYRPLSVDGEHLVKLRTLSASTSIKLNDSTLVTATVNGLHYLELDYSDSLSVKYTNKFWKMRINDIKHFRDGLLVCTTGHLHYINKYNKAIPLVNQEFRTITIENNRTIWAGNNKGLHRIILKNENSLKINSVHYYNQENTKDGLKSNFIKALYCNHLGIVWVGTEGGGVSKLINQANKFAHYNDLLQSNNLNKSKVSAIYEDSQENLWIGTTHQGVTYFPQGNNNYRTQGIDYNTRDKEHHNTLAFQEIVSRGKRYIIASTHYPIDIQLFSLEGERITSGPLYASLKSLRHPVFAMAADEHYLWLGTYAAGLYRIGLQNYSKLWLPPKTTHRISSKIIRSLYSDSQNRLWIGTDKGLNLMPAEEKRKAHPHVKVFCNEANNDSSISYDYILPILETKDHEIWVGTLGGGLNKYNEDDESFTRLTSKDGLPNNSIKGLAEDQEGNLWISSNKGLSRLNRTNLEIRNYSITDGLQDYEFREVSACARRSGELLFGGNNGFNSFYPNTIKTDSSTARIMITQLKVNSASNKHNFSFQIADLIRQIDKDEALTLSYKENSFTAYFTALHFIAPEKINYKYRLIGFDQAWNHISAQSRFAKYTNLNPGHYTLEILASNSDGIWAKQALALRITISKPWYSTWLAIFIYWSIAIATLLFFRRYSFIRNKIKSELMMEHFEKEKVEELTQIKLRFFTNISHELRTPLTIIKSYFDGISKQWENLPQEKITNDFGIINRNIDSLMRLINQILDFRKMEQNKMELKLEKEDIISFIHDIMGAFEQMATDQGISLTLHHEEQELYFHFDKEKMEKIINNLLSNALRYTPSQGQINIYIANKERNISIAVQDNGIGIKAEVQKHIFDRFYQAQRVKAQNSTGIGLSLTKGLVELHQGHISVESQIHQGSRFTITMPMALDQSLSQPAQEQATHNTEIPELDNKINSSHDFVIEKFKEKTILIVEDNNDLRAFLVDTLGQHFNVLDSENGALGLKQCLQQFPDMVISDVMMPVMDGYELCHSIKNNEQISHIPVLLLTAKNTDESELQGFQLGADAYISKPFNLEVLIARILSVFSSREHIIDKIAHNPFFTSEDVSLTLKDEEFLNKITAIIEDHMTAPEFSVEQLAEAQKISKLNLNKKIKALTGRTSVQYIRLTRLRRAAELLKQKHNRVSDVTYEVGYTDLQHFREHFKKEFGMAPSVYQKENTKGEA